MNANEWMTLSMQKYYEKKKKLLFACWGSTIAFHHREGCVQHQEAGAGHPSPPLAEGCPGARSAQASRPRGAVLFGTFTRSFILLWTILLHGLRSRNSNKIPTWNIFSDFSEWFSLFQSFSFLGFVPACENASEAQTEDRGWNVSLVVNHWLWCSVTCSRIGRESGSGGRGRHSCHTVISTLCHTM